MQWPNCIDPAPFYDKKGRLWMTYGSWSGGIFLLELDPETGLVIHPQADEENQVDPYFGKRLIGGGHNSIEGPYIQYDETYPAIIICMSPTAAWSAPEAIRSVCSAAKRRTASMWI